MPHRTCKNWYNVTSTRKQDLFYRTATDPRAPATSPASRGSRARDRRACGRDPASATPASAIAPPASSTGPGTWPSQTSEITIAAAGSNTSCAEMIQRACARAGFVPRVVARATDFAVLLSLVAAGAGLTLVPDLDALTEAAQDLPAAA